MSSKKTLLKKIEDKLLISVAQIHAAIEIARQAKDSELVRSLENLQASLKEIAQQEVSWKIDTLCEPIEYSLEQIVQIDCPYHSYHSWIGKIASINVRNNTVEIAFPGVVQRQVIGVDKITKAWKVPVSRLTRA